MKILPVRVLNANGGGVASDVANGIIWAADHGARVINVSLGGGQSPGIQQAMQYANSKGAVVVCAGGNNGESGNAPMYPAAYPEAIAVAAVDTDLSHPSFGNTGSYLDVSAPGVGIVSAWGSSTDRVRGRERHVDGDAVRVGGGGADHRREPERSRPRGSRRSSRTTATHLGPALALRARADQPGRRDRRVAATAPEGLRRQGQGLPRS